ncbi:hypothetical protein Q1J55_01715 [Pseudomonas syringae]|uniref:hypothetical protein n=1 Tax=Pseudomonas syringae TaxID=317 RepID=UPI0034D3DF95
MQKAGEEGLRLGVRPGTKRALRELMEWAEIEEQCEALTLMIHNLHALEPGGALPMFKIPRHEIRVSNIVALEFHRRSMLMIQRCTGDEIIEF